MSETTTAPSRLYPATKALLRERHALKLAPPYVRTEAELADYYIRLGIEAQDKQAALAALLTPTPAPAPVDPGNGEQTRKDER